MASWILVVNPASRAAAEDALALFKTARTGDRVSVHQTTNVPSLRVFRVWHDRGGRKHMDMVGGLPELRDHLLPRTTVGLPPDFKLSPIRPDPRVTRELSRVPSPPRVDVPRFLAQQRPGGGSSIRDLLDSVYVPGEDPTVDGLPDCRDMSKDPLCAPTRRMFLEAPVLDRQQALARRTRLAQEALLTGHRMPKWTL